METKFTPGPWRVGFSDGSGMTYITGRDEKVVVSGCPDSWGIEQGVTDEANAALVAAAPELYTALESMNELVGHAISGGDGRYVCNDPTFCEKCKAEAALKKARGGQ